MSESRPSLGEAVRESAARLEPEITGEVSPEELAAYRRGKLGPERREEVEAHLAWSREDAELARDFDLLTGARAAPEAGTDEAWARFRRRLEGAAGERPAAGSRAPAGWSWALAAMLLVSTALSLLWGLRQSRRLEEALAPRANPVVADLSQPGAERDGARQPVALALPPSSWVVLSATLAAEPRPRGPLRARLVDAQGRERLSVAGLEPSEGGEVTLALAPGTLPPGEYRLELWAGDRAEPVAVLPFRVTARP